MSVTLYGIKNCDTMKKAMQWLKEHHIDYVFHDYKKAGIDVATLRGWLAQVSHEDLINRRGTTWRKLDPAQQENLDQERAIALMQTQPSLIKRPVLVHEQNIHLGYSADSYVAIFGE